MCIPQGDPRQLRVHSLVEEMVRKNIDYTMVRCGILGDALDWDRASVEDTAMYAEAVVHHYGQAAEALVQEARRAPRCQNLLLDTSLADSYVMLDL